MINGITGSTSISSWLSLLEAQKKQSSGVITEDQTEAIKSAFRQAMDMNRALKAYGVE